MQSLKGRMRAKSSAVLLALVAAAAQAAHPERPARLVVASPQGQLTHVMAYAAAKKRQTVLNRHSAMKYGRLNS